MKSGTIFKVKNLGSGFFKFNKNAPITEFKIDKKSKSRTFTYDPYGILMPNVKKISSIKKNSKI